MFFFAGVFGDGWLSAGIGISILKTGWAKIYRIKNSVYNKLIERHAAQAPALRERFHKSKIPPRGRFQPVGL